MDLHLLELLRLLRSILRARLLSVLYGSTIEGAADDMVTNPWEVLYPSASYENNAVLLEVVSFAWNIGDHFLAIGHPDPSHFSEG